MKSIIKNFLLFLFIISMGIGGTSFAQPHIPKENIPSNIPKDVRQQIEGLYSKDPLARARSAGKLGEMGEKAVPAIPFLIEMLDDSAPCPIPGARYEILPRVFMSVQRALEKIGTPAVELLIDALLRNKNLLICSGAAEVLGEIKDSRAVEPLIYILKGGDSQTDKETEDSAQVRRAAAYALGAIKDTRAVEPLIAILTTDSSLEVKVAASSALANINDYRAVEPLIAFLKTDLGGYRTTVIMALASMKDTRAVEPLSDLFDGGNENSAFDGLAQIKGPYFVMEDERAVKYVLDSLNGNHPSVGIRRINEALAELDSMEYKGTGTDSLGIRARFFEPLINALNDEEGNDGAVEALLRIKNIKAIEPLISCLNDENEYFRNHVVESLKEILFANVKDEYKTIPDGETESFLLPVAERRLGTDYAKWLKWWGKNKDKFKQ